jgi:transposase
LSPARSFKNSPAGFKLFLRWLKKYILSDDIPLIFVMEATGVWLGCVLPIYYY